MSQTDVLRPVSTNAAGSGVATPSGTLHGVTSDNSDSTYIAFDIVNHNGDNWSVRMGSHTPSANYQRHRLRGRVRIRCDAGTTTEDIDVGRGTVEYIEYGTVPVNTTITEQSTPWFQDPAFGLSTSGALSDLNIGGGFANWTDGASSLRTMEVYLDVDCRMRPDYTAQVRDAAGTDKSGGTVTDTTQPTLYFGGVNYDGLPSLDWSVSLTGGFSASGSGTAPTSVPVTDNLANGSYTATFSVRSTIRGSDAFEHVETVSFTIANTVPPPSPPLVTVTSEFGGYRVNWVNPGGQTWDNDYVVAEVWRDDCTGSQRIATVPDGLNGSYLDLAIPQLDPIASGPDCEVSSEPCDITYRVRYWGYVSTSVELPDTIPADMILGWPSTAGSIPSGWSRVTALDTYLPRGATGTGAPSATGGASTHTHSTPFHQHTVAAHSHSVGGSTGTSNASTTSARFNGASQPQADQPHSHTRPSATGASAAFNSGNTQAFTNSGSNLPAVLDVIWIKSTGSQPNYPSGCVGWATESVSGWSSYAAASGRYLRGAAAAGNGGGTSGSNSHSHTIDAHTHTGGTHDHSIGATGLSNPASSQEAGYGSSTPRWLPRHTHPLDVGANSSGNLASASGGATGTWTNEPPNRRLRVLRNSGGGTQTRIIGLYTGAVGSLDPLLTLCNGTNGTPDMRGYFCRDAGSDSVNSVGGSSTHTHTLPNHSHGMPTHSHSVTVLTSTTGSFEAPSVGDLGSSPTTGHTHSSATSATAVPSTSSEGAGTSGSSDHTPPYKEVHFVRLDGTISGGPLPVPELKTSDYASVTVPAATYADGLDRLIGATGSEAIAPDRSSDFPRSVTDSTPLAGGLHTVSDSVPGEEMDLTIAVQGLPAINRLEALLAEDRLYFAPVSGTPGWFAPGSWTVQPGAPDVKVVQITMVRQPWPDTADPGEYL